MPVVDHDTWREELTANSLQELVQKGELPTYFKNQVDRIEQHYQQDRSSILSPETKREAFLRSLYVVSRWAGKSEAEQTARDHTTARAIRSYTVGFRDAILPNAVTNQSNEKNIQEILIKIGNEGLTAEKRWAVMGYIAGRMLEQPWTEGGPSYTGLAHYDVQNYTDELLPLEETFQNWPLGDVISSLSQAVFIAEQRGDVKYKTPVVSKNFVDARDKMQEVLRLRLKNRAVATAGKSPVAESQTRRPMY